MFSFRMGLGLGSMQKSGVGIDYGVPEFLSVVSGAGALWKTISPSLSKPTVAERIALADACVTSYNAKGYGTATKYDMGLTEDEGYHQYAYIFAPSGYTKTFVHTAAVHPYEAASSAATLLLMQLLSASITDANTSNAYVNYLRHNVRMVIVPMYNPYGHTVWQVSADEYETDGRYNSNTVDLNRNLDYNWNDHNYRTVHGASAGSEQESINFLALLAEIGVTNIDFFLDAHNNNIYDGDGVANYDSGKQALYAPISNFNDPYCVRTRTWLQQLLDHYTGADGLGAGTLPLAAANYVVRDEYYLVAGNTSNYTQEALGILSATCEHAHMHDFNKRWTSLDEHVTRDCEQKLAYFKLFDAIGTELAAAEEADWYAPLFAYPALDTMALNASADSGDLTTVADIIALNADAEVAYTYGTGEGETDVYGVERGEGSKTILIVGVADDVTDALVIHRAIAELDKYAAKTKLASLLTDCTITFVPSANPEGASISDWAASAEDEAVALRTYAAGFDYVFAIAPHSADGNIDYAAAAITPTISGYDFIDAQGITDTELTAAVGITGATIYLNNSIAATEYHSYRYSDEDHEYRYGDIKHAPLLAYHISAIINSAAAWNTEELTYYDADYDTYVAAVVADGGAIMDADLLMSRIAFLKSNGLWSDLQAEYSASFGVKYDANNKILKYYNIKNAAHTATSTEGSEPILYEDTGLGIYTGAFGDPGNTPAYTPIACPSQAAAFKNRSYGYAMNVIKAAVSSTVEYNLWTDNSVVLQQRLALVMRGSYKYSVQSTRTIPGALYSTDSDSTYATDGGVWRVLEGICNWKDGAAYLRLDGSQVGTSSSLFGSDGDDLSNNNDATNFIIGGSHSAATYRIFQGHIALTGIWADILPSSDQLTANYNWVAANILGVS